MVFLFVRVWEIILILEIFCCKFDSLWEELFVCILIWIFGFCFLNFLFKVEIRGVIVFVFVKVSFCDLIFLLGDRL